MASLLTFLLGAFLSLFFVRRYLRQLQERDARARESLEKGKIHSGGPIAQHPSIDTMQCMGCATCTTVCPEGDVLAMLGGKAAIVNGHKCIGHGLCADACPVGAITMVMAQPGARVDVPFLTPQFETTVPNLFIVGELGGLALVKNAVNQGRECVDIIADRISDMRQEDSHADAHDILIVGAGPAGISASLRSIERRLKYVTIEQEEIGGTVAKYPRQKMVLTSPVDIPMYGKFKKTELSKERLLDLWNKVLSRADFKARMGEKVEHIEKGPDGVFSVTTPQGQYRSHTVVLALGRGGTPRKLGVKGEDLPNVMYRLIEAESYVNKKILVVGGGDSAVEAALGLAQQAGNRVTLSYRQSAFSRIKERNAKRIEECRNAGKVEVLLESRPVEFKPSAVVLDVQGQIRELDNDYAWIFAGGEAPTAFLKKIGVGFGLQDVTRDGDGAREAPRPAGAFIGGEDVAVAT
jgi:thioredoxin reductase (NADPH)